jgi:lipopolysaccharide O-acetyltransferase
MNILLSIYWKISFIIYGFRIHHIGKNAKFRLGGSVKNGKYIIIGDDFFIGKDFLLGVYPIGKDLGGCIKIGNNVVAQESVRISAAESVEIGNNVLIGSYILISDNNHGMDASNEKDYMYQNITAKPVSIGDGCWIGEKVTILPGSNIGEKCIIGANSVVTGTIPPYTISVGAPARPIKRWNKEKNCWERILVKSIGEE